MSQEAVLKSRKILLNQYYGVLSTHSVDCEGYPFGSILPFCPDFNNRPIILISRLAQHTKNIEKDPRVSLLIDDADQLQYADVQTCSRLTVMANAERLTDAEVIARCHRYLPDAHDYTTQLDFDFYRLNPVKVRFIGGFGQIHWVEPAHLFTANPFDSEAEASVVEHMNEDHGAALLRYCEQENIIVPESLGVVMTGVDSYGFHLRIGHRLCWFEFDKPVQSLDQVRAALIRRLHA